MERLTAQWGARARRWRWSGVAVGMLLIALGAGARPAAAQTLIGNMGADDAGSFSISFLTHHSVSFTTTGTYALTAVRLRLVPGATYANGIVEIRNDAGGMGPGSTTLVSFANPSITPNVAQDVTFTPTAPFEFQENTKYWLSMRGTSGTNQWDWAGANLNTPPAGPGATFGEYRGSFNGGLSWVSTSTTRQFEIEGTPVQSSDTPAVPEPSAALLFLPALGVVALARRRRSG